MNNSAHLDTLIEKHHSLQAAIDDEIHRPLPDQTRLTQLKREKLKLKEQISSQTQ
ncbi:YdcH family protein [Ferrovibrio sp.]|uniref:YdcH family protein n=1 Tax=Ferrovibrio sp. TaxID=1917215 RepID=UPI0026284C86|nr:YdcH family protein [Ferrovibrio sp.]